MERLFLFLFQYRAFFTFLALQFISVWLLVRNNQYQGAAFFNSSNAFVANVNAMSKGVGDYFALREVNQQLAEENAMLKTQLEQQTQRVQSFEAAATTSSVLPERYSFVSAKVVNNSVAMARNHLTIDKGRKDGVAPGMAVINAHGVVGKVKTVSNHFAVVTSVLHTDVMVSAIIKRNGYFGTVQWDGADPEVVNLKYIPRHVHPTKGDTITTSGYNAIFPEGIIIGTIESMSLRDEELFYDLRIRLSHDFRRLSYVAVVQSNLKEEQDQLESTLDMKR